MRRISLLAVAAFALSGCFWKYSLSGGALPSHIRNAAILPFDNQTASPDLQRELAEGLRKAFASRLGLREAAEDRASAIVRGTIVQYETDVPIAFSANPAQATSARRRLQLRVDVEIFDVQQGKVLWSQKGISAEGDYGENDEPAGRRQAVERIINDVIEGVQSQW
jgi:type IV pilus biogenesis protein CpaD/CtpE